MSAEWHRDAALLGQGCLKDERAGHHQVGPSPEEQALAGGADPAQREIDRRYHLGDFVAARGNERLAIPLGQEGLVGLFHYFVGEGFAGELSGVGVGYRQDRVDRNT